MYLGLDFGTSALKATIVDAPGQVRFQLRRPWTFQASTRPNPELWWQALNDFFITLPKDLRLNVDALAIAATSGSILALTATGQPGAAAWWYAATPEPHPKLLDFSKKYPEHPAAAANSALNKALYLLEEVPDTQALRSQGDWLTGKLLGHFAFGDSHNALKLGFDPISDAFLRLPLLPNLLPTIYPPLTYLGTIAQTLAWQWQLPKNLKIFSGCTDSSAAFMASGAEALGDAFSSLGSTLVLKVVSQTPLFDSQRGIYSHRFGTCFLVGGASNVGMAVLSQFFSPAEIHTLAQRPYQEAIGLDYYPLITPGERFPLADPQKAPQLTPRPEDNAAFFQGILEGIAQVEVAGYAALQAVGAPWPKRVFSVGGGSANALLTTIRNQRLPLVAAVDSEAAVGLARWLAKAAG